MYVSILFLHCKSLDKILWCYRSDETPYTVKAAYDLPSGDQNFKQGARMGAKLMIFSITSSEQTTKFPAYLALLKR